MAQSKFINNEAAVTAHIANTKDRDIAALLQTIREIVLTTDLEIGEHIKWNSPAFFYKGEMNYSDPKAYKRDMLVCNFHRGSILLIFPTGAIIKNVSPILEGNYEDGRRIITIINSDDVSKKKDELQKLIKEWLKLTRSENLNQGKKNLGL